MKFRASLKADAQPPMLMKPRSSALHDPAEQPQTTSVLGVAPSQERLNPSEPKTDAVGFGVETAIAVHPTRTESRSATCSAQGRNAVHKRVELVDIGVVGSGELDDQRYPVTVREQVMLAAGTASIHGAWAAFFPRLRPPERVRNRPRPAPNRFRRLGSGVRAGCDGASPKRPPPATRAAFSSKSRRCHSPSPAAGTPRESRCGARTGSPSGSGDRPCACAPGSGTCACGVEGVAR